MLSLAVSAGTGRQCRGGQFYQCLVETDWHGQRDPFQTECADDTGCTMQWEELDDDERRQVMAAFGRAEARTERNIDNFIDRVSRDLYRAIMEQ